MVNFDRTQTSFIEDQIRKSTDDAKIGKVKKVFEHTGEAGAPDAFLADVTIEGGTAIERGCPFLHNERDSIEIPVEGDSVMLEYVGEQSKKPVIIGFVSTKRDPSPEGKAGMSRQRFESLSNENGVPITTPMGEGDLFLTKHSSRNDSGRVTESRVQIAKHEEKAEPENEPNAMIELFDSNSESYIELSGNVIGGTGADQRWGIKLDFTNGDIRLVNSKGNGIVIEGDRVAIEAEKIQGTDTIDGNKDTENFSL